MSFIKASGQNPTTGSSLRSVVSLLPVALLREVRETEGQAVGHSDGGKPQQEKCQYRLELTRVLKKKNTCKHLTRNPTVFSGNGTEDCGKWMKDYERIARSNCLDATMKLANAPFFLEGTAGQWYDNNEEGMDSWDMFKEMFSRTFDNSGVLLRRAKDNLQSRAQKSTESCESYIQDVLSLCRQVNPDMSQGEKVAHLMKGVVEDVYQVILIKEIDTVEAFVDWCQKVEACKQRRIGKPRFERLPNVASIEQPNSSSLEDLIRRIVREEIKSALHFESIVPEVNSLKKIIHEEVERNLTPIAEQGPYYREQRRHFEGPAKPTPYYQQQSPTRLTTARRKTDEWRTVDNIPVCFQCGRPGHVARYCRERRGMVDRQPPGRYHPVQNGPRTIYNSDETPGRASYRSPSPYPGRGRSPAERRPSISPSRRSGRSPYPAKLSQNIVDVTIDDKTFPALVDSGASFSVISDHFRQQHKKTMFSDAGMTLRVADGKYIVSRGRCTLRLEINGLVQPFELIVLPSCSHDIILGWDFLEASRAIIDCGSAEILLEKAELPEDSSSIFQTVAADDSFIIPAGSTKQINVISETILGVSDVVMEPSRILFLERDLMVPASIFAVQHGKGRIWITNIGTCDRTVPKGMCIGEIQVLEEGQLAVIGDASDTNRQEILGQENSPNIASMISPDLSMLERTWICSILGSFSGLFEFNKFPSNLTSTAKHKINTEDHPPIKRRPYRVSQVERQTIQNEVDKMLKGGIVQLSESPWSSPVVLVKKKNGSWRFCVDYRHLNKITKKDVYPLPRIDDTLDCLRGASYYSSMDLRSGYWQIEVDEADREKTAFIRPDGLYEFKVMPFGLCNAPATFERMMDTLLRGLKWSMCLCYLDDIIVFSPTFDEHVRRLELVLRCLSKAGLVLNPDKCLFGTKRLSIFGHLVDGEGVHPDPGKVDAMSKFPTPKSLTDVRSFIGMCSYYRRFIKNFAQKAEPLHRLLRKDTRFEWGPDQRQAYESLKLALASEPVLAHFDEKKHQDADCLSRNPIEANNPGESGDDIPTLAALTDIVAEQRKDPVIVGISEECLKNDQNRFKIINGALYKRNFDPVGQPWLLVIPRHLRPDVLRSLHDNPTAGHLGLAKTHDRIRRKYFWPGLLRSIRKYVGHCRECQRRKHAPLRPPGLLQPIPPTSVPFQRVGIDLLGRFPISHLGNKWIIVCTDYLTRYAITRALPSADAQQVAKFVLEDVVLKHGAPREIITDRGRVFQSKLISELTGLCSSAQRFTTAYHPQTNGLTERLNKTLADMMSMYVDVEQKEWDVILPFITFAYNTAKQDTTGYTPFSLIHGREAETTLDTLFPLLKDEDQEDYNREIVTRAEETRQLARLHTLRAQEGNKRLYDAKHREVSYQPGDKVWIFIPVRKIGISEKLIKRYFGPYRVTRRISDVTYEVESLDTTNRRRKPKEIVHVVRMKNYRDPDELAVAKRESAIKPPTNQKTLQSFLGAVNVYNKFIPDYARLRAPLNKLLKKDVKWNWDPDCQQAFTTLKESLTSKPVLHLYQVGLPCRLYCDASTQGIAGILKQVHPDGQVHPVQYFSRALRAHERNYTVSELECLAIVESVDKFRIYLTGIKFTIYTDHQALQWLKTIKNPSGRLFRWSLRLSTYNYEIHYLKGSQQYEADLLSRNPFVGFVSADIIKQHQPTASPFNIDTNGLHTITRKGVIKIIIPETLQHTLMNKVHQEYNHPGISQMTRIITAQYYWKGISKSIEKFVKSCHTCQIIKRPKGKPYGALGQIPPPQQPFDLISIDTIAGFSKYGHSKTYLHVIVDHLTRYAWTFPSKSTSTLTYIQTLKTVLQQGSPKRLLSDRAPAFTSEKFRKFLITHGIQPLLTTSNNPQANGLIERLNATITGKLRLAYLENPKASWTQLVKRVTQTYNNTPHSVTSFPPTYLMFNVIPPDLRTHLDPYPEINIAREIANSRTQNKHKKDKEKFDKQHRTPHFEVNDLVLVKNYRHPDTGKLAPYFTGPYKIIEIISPNVVRIDRPNQPLNRDSDTIHVNKLKYYTENVLYITPPQTRFAQNPQRLSQDTGSTTQWQADLAPKEMAASDMRNRRHVQQLLTWSTNAAHPVSLEPLQDSTAVEPPCKGQHLIAEPKCSLGRGVLLPLYLFLDSTAVEPPCKGQHLIAEPKCSLGRGVLLPIYLFLDSTAVEPPCKGQHLIAEPKCSLGRGVLLPLYLFLDSTAVEPPCKGQHIIGELKCSLGRGVLLPLYLFLDSTTVEPPCKEHLIAKPKCSLGKGVLLPLYKGGSINKMLLELHQDVDDKEDKEGEKKEVQDVAVMSSLCHPLQPAHGRTQESCGGVKVIALYTPLSQHQTILTMCHHRQFIDNMVHNLNYRLEVQ
ncbi:hypothetical protein LAZ67_3003037, partial [Cordylochernes scorpioides]